MLLECAMALTVALALPSCASAQGQGKRILLYTGTTGFRHTDGINGGRRSFRASSRRSATRSTGRTATATAGAATTNCNNADKNPRIFTDANLARYDAIVFLNMSWSCAGGNRPGPLLEDAAEGRDHQVRPERRRHRRRSTTRPTPGAGQSVWDWWDGEPELGRRHHMPGHAATNATGNAATVQVADPNHLSTKDLPDTWTIADEHYNFLRNVRGDHHVLATFDERTYNPGVNARGQDHPITWCKLYDGDGLNDGTPTPPDVHATAAPGSPAWATSASATPRTAATTTWSR